MSHASQLPCLSWWGFPIDADGTKMVVCFAGVIGETECTIAVAFGKREQWRMSDTAGDYVGRFLGEDLSSVEVGMCNLAVIYLEKMET